MRLGLPLLVFGCAAALALGACQAASPPPIAGVVTDAASGNDADATGSAALAAQLQAQIGDAPCSEDAQCHTLAWGTKACGGPERWVPWSSQNADPAAVKALGERYGDARREDHLRSGGVSTCFIVADPGAHCAAGHCQLGSAGSAPVSQ